MEKTPISSAYRTPLHPRGFINRWLVVGPFPIRLASGEVPDEETRRLAPLGALGARWHPIPTDAAGRLVLDPPRAGDPVTADGITINWEWLDGGDDYTVCLFDRFTPPFNSIAYLYAEIEIPSMVAALRCRVERGAQIWIDGEPQGILYGAKAKMGETFADAWLPAFLAPGRHTVVVKCWQCRSYGSMNGWGLQLQLVAPDERPACEGNVILPVRDEAEARLRQLQAEAQRTTLTPDVQVGDRVQVRVPAALADCRVQLRFPEADVTWTYGASAGAGPVPAEWADSHRSVEVAYLDSQGAVVASVSRALWVVPEGEWPVDSLRAVLEAIAAKQGGKSFNCGAGLVARYALGRAPDDPVAFVGKALDHIDRREDCSDFALLWLIRWRRLFGDAPGSAALAGAIDQRRLDFIYNPVDSKAHLMCMTTENHRAAFWVCELLAGEEWPGTAFTVTGQGGNWHAARAREALLDWIEQKMRHGFGEWGCPYLLVDLDLLYMLLDFCRDRDVVEAAGRLADKILLLLVNDAWQGALAGAQSRAYAEGLLAPHLARPAADVLALLGDPQARPVGGAFAVGLATSKRRPPDGLRAGLNPKEEILIRERQGHQPHIARRMIFRTPDVALASALIASRRDLLKQKLPWCAHLSGGIKIFTSHPGPGNINSNHRCNYWAGTITAPRLGQARSALLCFYDVPPLDPWGYTHAHWPQHRFDETIEVAGWYFGRVAKGYVGLRPLPAGQLVMEGRYGGRELIAAGARSGWVCQVGSGQSPADFAKFVELVSVAPAQLDADGLTFDSPTEGHLALTATGDFQVDGQPQDWPDDLHIDAPWAFSAWGEGVVHRREATNAPQGTSGSAGPRDDESRCL